VSADAKPARDNLIADSAAATAMAFKKKNVRHIAQPDGHSVIGGEWVFGRYESENLVLKFTWSPVPPR
jgi:hypothetical protein